MLSSSRTFLQELHTSTRPPMTRSSVFSSSTIFCREFFRRCPKLLLGEFHFGDVCVRSEHSECFPVFVSGCDSVAPNPNRRSVSMAIANDLIVGMAGIFAVLLEDVLGNLAGCIML